MIRSLNEFQTLVRHNSAIHIIRKINASENNLSPLVSSISPFGIPTNFKGESELSSNSNIKVYSSSGYFYISQENLPKGKELLSGYKVILSQTSAEHAGEPSKDGTYKILTSSMSVCSPNEACTHSYLLLGKFNTFNEAKNLLNYLKTRFVRFLILQALSSIHITKSTFAFVPLQDFSKPWTDAELYAKYGLDEEEIAFIESMIKPMELEA